VASVACIAAVRRLISHIRENEHRVAEVSPATSKSAYHRNQIGRNKCHGKDVPGASRMELSEHVVAMLKLVASVGLHAKNELDSETVEPEGQDSGYPSSCQLSFSKGSGDVRYKILVWRYIL
jgi:hypothetical protein